jgi:hypothetical protein
MAQLIVVSQPWGPVALHRLPENVAHIAEALWMQALDDARRRAALE